MPPTTDATPVHLDKNAGDSSASSNMFAEFLRTSDNVPGQTTAMQCLHEMDKAMAGGSTAFNALPKLEIASNVSDNDRKFNVVAALNKQPDNDIANAALDKALNKVA